MSERSASNVIPAGALATGHPLPGHAGGGLQFARIEDAHFEVRSDWVLESPHASLARIVRL